LGVPNQAESLEREKKIVAWLDFIKADAAEIFLVGDLFDFWFEFKTVVPKGFVRLLGKLAELSDSGIKLHIFHGNHDLWQFGYLKQELNATIYNNPITIERFGKIFHVAHGDGLGPKQYWFKFILGIYRNWFFQRLFALFHPNIGIGLANWFSAKSKEKTATKNTVYYGDDKEYLMLYAKSLLQTNNINYFVFGHRHLPMQKEISNQTQYINLGDWISHFSYLEVSTEGVLLKTFKSHA